MITAILDAVSILGGLGLAINGLFFSRRHPDPAQRRLGTAIGLMGAGFVLAGIARHLRPASAIEVAMISIAALLCWVGMFRFLRGLKAARGAGVQSIRTPSEEP